MEFALPILLFVAGYLAIAMEHSLRLDKAASALLTGALLWMIIFTTHGHSLEQNLDSLSHHLAEIASIAFFLLGAMTIVELIDTHNGFDFLSEQLRLRNFFQLTIAVSIATFFLSALLDNLTTTIVMISIIRKWIDDKQVRWWMASLIIISANAGGAWSPLGDVTTTMLWVGGQISASTIVSQTLLPSIMVSVLPSLIIGYKFRHQKLPDTQQIAGQHEKKEGVLILVSGVLLLLSVPLVKTLTHLPPYICMLFSLSIMWIIVSVLHFNKPVEEKWKFQVSHALQKIDTPSILFFVGILLAVGALENMEILHQFSLSIQEMLPDYNELAIALGLLSALIDNVPMVAAIQGMFSLATFPKDHNFWLFLALTTGTGGSAIIIGSAAGVAAMGLEKIPFGWYLKHISWLALLGYFVGILTFILI